MEPGEILKEDLYWVSFAGEEDFCLKKGETKSIGTVTAYTVSGNCWLLSNTRVTVDLPGGIEVSVLGTDVEACGCGYGSIMYIFGIKISDDITCEEFNELCDSGIQINPGSFEASVDIEEFTGINIKMNGGSACSEMEYYGVFISEGDISVAPGGRETIGFFELRVRDPRKCYFTSVPQPSVNIGLSGLTIEFSKIYDEKCADEYIYVRYEVKAILEDKEFGCEELLANFCRYIEGVLTLNSSDINCNVYVECRCDKADVRYDKSVIGYCISGGITNITVNVLASKIDMPEPGESGPGYDDCKVVAHVEATTECGVCYLNDYSFYYVGAGYLIDSEIISYDTDDNGNYCRVKLAVSVCIDKEITCEEWKNICENGIYWTARGCGFGYECYPEPPVASSSSVISSSSSIISSSSPCDAPDVNLHVSVLLAFDYVLDDDSYKAIEIGSLEEKRTLSQNCDDKVDILFDGHTLCSGVFIQSKITSKYKEYIYVTDYKNHVQSYTDVTYCVADCCGHDTLTIGIDMYYTSYLTAYICMTVVFYRVNESSPYGTGETTCCESTCWSNEATLKDGNATVLAPMYYSTGTIIPPAGYELTDDYWISDEAGNSLIATKNQVTLCVQTSDFTTCQYDPYPPIYDLNYNAYIRRK